MAIPLESQLQDFQRAAIFVPSKLLELFVGKDTSLRSELSVIEQVFIFSGTSDRQHVKHVLTSQSRLS